MKQSYRIDVQGSLSRDEDSQSEFEPQLVKNQTSFSGDIEEKILSVYAKGSGYYATKAGMPFSGFPAHLNTALSYANSAFTQNSG